MVRRLCQTESLEVHYANIAFNDAHFGWLEYLDGWQGTFVVPLFTSQSASGIFFTSGTQVLSQFDQHLW
jgi:hypothetical protein